MVNIKNKKIIILVVLIMLVILAILYVIYNTKYGDNYIKEAYTILKDYKLQKINNTDANQKIKTLHQKATTESLDNPKLTKTCLKMGIIEQYFENKIDETEMNKNIKELDKIYK